MSINFILCICFNQFPQSFPLFYGRNIHASRHALRRAHLPDPRRLLLIAWTRLHTKRYANEYKAVFYHVFHIFSLINLVVAEYSRSHFSRLNWMETSLHCASVYVTQSPRFSFHSAQLEEQIASPPSLPLSLECNKLEWITYDKNRIYADVLAAICWAGGAAGSHLIA